MSVASTNIPVELAPMETATDPALPAFALRVKVDAFVIEFEITLPNLHDTDITSSANSMNLTMVQLLLQANGDCPLLGVSIILAMLKSNRVC